MPISLIQEQGQQNVISLSSRKPMPEERIEETMRRHIDEMLRHARVDKGILSGLYYALSTTLLDEHFDEAKELAKKNPPA